MTTSKDPAQIINLAIIAHVDHGKTTLVDQLLWQSQTARKEDGSERVMDSDDIERERGITILAKNTAIRYNDSKINIVDTPGHADFGGEVERVLRMVDATLLLVDASEGPMPQTRFVLQKSLRLGHRILVVVNKIDRPNCDPENALNQVFDLFVELKATDEQLDFPVIYASAKEGFAVADMSAAAAAAEAAAAGNPDLTPMLDMVLEHAPTARSSKDGPEKLSAPFQFQVTTLDYDNYLGRICIGRIWNGQVKVGDTVKLIGDGSSGSSSSDKSSVGASSGGTAQTVVKHKITKLFEFKGLERIPVESAGAGDIVAVAGIPEMTIGDTLCDPEQGMALDRIEIEPPTVSMQFSVNDSPFAGKDGEYVTSRNIRERLAKELKANIAIQVIDKGDSFEVLGRGELQLAVLIENMRREGFELGVSKPEVIMKEEGGKKLEPYELVWFDVPDEWSGSVIQELNRRKGTMTSMENMPGGYVRLQYEIPTRGIIGFRSFFLTETRGEGTMAGNFLDYREFAGKITGRTKGAIVSLEEGQSNAYALFNLQERGEMFIGAGVNVYRGMIIGLSAKEGDMDVNPLKGKKLTNVRASGSDDAVRLTPPRLFSLEESLDFLEADELLEVTPQHLRLRKKVLDPTQRRKLTKAAAAL